MISRFDAVLWTSLLLLALAASAQEGEPETAPQDDDGADAPAAAETCFDAGRAQDINVISDQHVYVGTVGGNHYLLTLAHRCRNLERSYRSGGVRIRPYGRRICPNDGSHLVYEWFGRESVCPILIIESVADRAEARTLAERNPSPVETEEVTLPD